VAQNVIGIDASRMLVTELTGTETYTCNIVRALLERPHEERYRLYLNASEPPTDLPGHPDVRLMPFPRIWTHVRLSLEMVRAAPDLLFVPAHVIPIIHPKSIVTIHDLGYLVYPDSHSVPQRRMLQAATRWNVRSARHIVVPSGTTARDVRSRLKVPNERITTIPHGVSPRFTPAPPNEIARIRKEHELDRPYILSVGTRHPRKNYGRLAQAHRHLLAQGHDIDLVIAGKRGWLADEVDRDLIDAGLGDRLRILDYVPIANLCPLYSGAQAFAMPSLYEGFGLPLLEAMACGTPAIAANQSSLVELAGDAAVLVDPLDVEALSHALVSVVQSENARATLSREGRTQARRFTWDEAASATANVFAQVLSAAP